MSDKESNRIYAAGCSRNSLAQPRGKFKFLPVSEAAVHRPWDTYLTKSSSLKLVLPASIAHVSLPHIPSDQQLPAKLSLRNPFQLPMTAAVAHRRREILQKTASCSSVHVKRSFQECLLTLGSYIQYYNSMRAASLAHMHLRCNRALDTSVLLALESQE